MASLQDQLLKAGVVGTNKAKQIKKAKHKQAKTSRKEGTSQPDEAQRLRQTALAEKQRKDREHNQRQQAAAEEKALAAQVTQLIRDHRIEREGDTGFQFSDGTKIKKIYVNSTIQKQLESGQVAVVKLAEEYEVVPLKTALKIRERAPEQVVFVSEQSPASHNAGDDDPYADYPIPDDLMW